MSTYIHGTFKDRKNKTVEVQIRSTAGSGEIIIGQNHDSDILFSDDPISIETVCDDLFTPIIKKSCQINLVTKIFLGDLVFAGNSQDVSVTVIRDEVVIFKGYVEPETFTQPYAKKYESFTLNCIDYLSTLQYKSLLDLHSYTNLVSNTSIKSFAYYIGLMGFSDIGDVYYDNSKTVSGGSALELCGVSQNIFIGESEDDVMTFEEMLIQILQYLNLHIIQNGADFYIFDWQTLINGNPSFNALGGGGGALFQSSAISVGKSNYASDTTSLSMSDVYNQIQVKCELETLEELIETPTDSNSLDSHFGSSQLYLTEYLTNLGDIDAFKRLITSEMTTDCYSTSAGTDSNNWKTRDWYVKWLYNPNWTLHYNNSDIISSEETYNNEYINQYKIMRLLRQHSCMPALVTLSQQKEMTTAKNNTRKTSKQISQNYLVISLNGIEDDSDEEATAIDTANEYGSGTVGLLTYNDNTAASYSPVNNGVTNYLVFSGKICFAPILKKSGSMAREQSDSITIDVQKSDIYNGYVNPNNFMEDMLSGRMRVFHKDFTNQDEGGYYAHVFWTARKTDDKPQATTDQMLYPPIICDKLKKYEYRYSSDGDTNDIYDKFPVLECELKIGDKYLVENTYGLNSGHTRYSWLDLAHCPYLKDDDGNVTEEKKTTFTLGFDPQIGDFIIGAEYELADTVDGRVSNETGTAIPITKQDAISGDLSFTIKGLVNTRWNQITRRHPTLFRHTKYYDNWVNILSHSSALWIKDFQVKLISDNDGKEVKTQAKDLIYMSDMTHSYIKKKDDIEFKLVTMPTIQESVELGIKSTVSKANVINTSNGLPLENITAFGETARPERLYISQYWNFYNQPKVIIDTDIHNNNYTFANTFSFTGFGQMLAQSMIYDVKQNNIHVTCRQI